MRLRASIFAVVAVVLLAGCATTHHNSTVPAGGHKTGSAPIGATVTKNRMFAPYDRSGASTAGVVAHRSGSCFTASITVATTNAYRCFAANTILDPCFSVPGSAHALECYTAPWSHATRLQVGKLPKITTAVHISRPWALELSGGRRCVVTNGTAQVVRHVALGYQCADGMAGLLAPATGSAVLKALYRSTDGVVRTVTVTTAWRAD